MESITQIQDFEEGTLFLFFPTFLIKPFLLHVFRWTLLSCRASLRVVAVIPYCAMQLFGCFYHKSIYHIDDCIYSIIFIIIAGNRRELG